MPLTVVPCCAELGHEPLGAALHDMPHRYSPTCLVATLCGARLEHLVRTISRRLQNSRRRHAHQVSDPVHAHHAETNPAGMDMTLWEAWYCHDGVTVFFGTSEENQDVIMVSLIVHAPPSLVTEVTIHSPLCSCTVNHRSSIEDPTVITAMGTDSAGRLFAGCTQQRRRNNSYAWCCWWQRFY